MNTATTKPDAWVPWVMYSGVAIVGAYCVGVSAVWLIQLAELCGMRGPLAWSIPVALDVGGAVATVVWVKAASVEARYWGAGISVGALGCSLLGNTLSHLIKASILPITPGLIIGVGAVPPVMFFLVIHLLVVSSNRPKLARRSKASQTVAPKTSHSPRATPSVASEAPAPAPVSPDPGAGADSTKTRPDTTAETSSETAPETKQDAPVDASGTSERDAAAVLDAIHAYREREDEWPSAYWLKKNLSIGHARAEKFLAQASRPALRPVREEATG